MNQYTSVFMICDLLKIRLQSFLITAITIVLASGAYAQQISPEMISQFQNLPRAQQEALAQQYGVDLDDILSSQSQRSESTIGQPGEPLQPVYQTNSDSSSASLYEVLQEAQRMEAAEDEDQPTRYGIELFDSEVTSFSPVDDALVPDSYRLGPGDNLVIQLFGTENEQYSLEVGRAGDINFPRFGPIAVAGMSFEDAKALIQRRVGEQLIGVDAVVSMGRLRAVSVFIAGEVKRPGSYAVSALSTVTEALFVSGGVSDIGSLRNIQVKRAGDTVGTFDVYDLLIRGDASNNTRLQSGDVVFVPPYSGIVEVEGAVRRPMLYEIDDGESIEDLIAMAGGFQSSAHLNSAVLQRARGSNDLPGLNNLDLSSARDLAILLRDGDALRVPVTTEFLENQISIEGAVIRPGNYAWYDGIRVSDLLRSVQADLLQDVDLGYALIVRMKNSRRDIEVQQFDLGAAISSKGSQRDPLLERQDRILVFGTPEEEALAAEQALEEEQKKLERDERLLALGFSPEMLLQEELAQEEEQEDEVPSHRRQDLLRPVLAKLRTQAREGQPVQVVSINGAVKVPGDYPLKQGDRMFDLIRAAGGLQDSAYMGGAEFRRVSEVAGGIKSDFFEVSLVAIGQENSTDNIELQSRDNLTVRQIPDWTPNTMITLAGEVRFPGTYLFGKGETLGDVLQRAGGLTEDGYASGALFTREIIREREAEQAEDYADQVVASYAAATLTREEIKSNYAEIQEIVANLRDYEGIGRMVIDLDSIVAGLQSADIALLDGDTLYIPQKSNAVTVVGEVQRSATHSYQSDFDTEDYLELSAGMTKRADEESIYIVKANGAVLSPYGSSWVKFQSKDALLEPGDTIVVPIDTEYKDRWSFWTDVTQILYQGGLAIAAVLAI